MTGVLTVDLRPELLPVRDQGSRPTCLAHSLSAAHEHRLGMGLGLSPEYLHYFSSAGHPTRGCHLAEGQAALQTSGQPEEAGCPYNAAQPAPGWRPDPVTKIYRRNSHRIASEFDAVVAELRCLRVVVLGVRLSEGFFGLSAPWVISPAGAKHNLHAVAAVGFGRTDGVDTILIRNSWGKRWGNGGYASLGRDFTRLHLLDAVVLDDEPSS